MIKETTKIKPGEFLIVLAPHKKALYNFILKCLRFHNDTEDLYQNTIESAFKNIHKFKGKSTFKTWLFSIVNNEIKRYFKGIKKDIKLTRQFITERLHQADFTDSRINSIYEIAFNFNHKYRKVFFLFYYNSFSISEIARITKIKPGTIKYILNFCREQIKNKLGVTQNENR